MGQCQKLVELTATQGIHRQAGQPGANHFTAIGREPAVNSAGATAEQCKISPNTF